jgi:hypothetical protein
MASEIPVIPPDMRKVYLRLKRSRSSQARRAPIPESLWAAAGELARAHGINPTYNGPTMPLAGRGQTPGHRHGKAVSEALSVSIIEAGATPTGKPTTPAP